MSGHNTNGKYPPPRADVSKDELLSYLVVLDARCKDLQCRLDACRGAAFWYAVGRDAAFAACLAVLTFLAIVAR